MDRIEKMFRVIEKADVGERDLRICQIKALAEKYNNSLISGAGDVFRYGFVQGMRAEQAKRKRGAGK